MRKAAKNQLACKRRPATAAAAPFAKLAAECFNRIIETGVLHLGWG